VLGLLGLCLVIYLYAVAGRKSSDQELHLLNVDRFYTEIYLASLVGTWSLAAVFMFEIFDLVYSRYWQSLSQEALMLFLAGFTGVLLLSIMFTMPLIRKIKARRFLKDCLCVRAIKRCWQIIKNAVLGIKGFFDGSAYKEHLMTKRLFRSQMTYICGSAGLLLFFGLMSAASGSFLPVFLFIVLELLITAWYVMGNKQAYSDINAGYVESLKSQMKSENTKTALITNVSHDLKTPLTSIITYVDLLAKEEDLSETSRDYVNIIAGKAERLKHIVADLFDLSKSVSGNIPMELDILDLKTLMEQTLADMKEPIEGSGHGIKINLGQEPVNIFSDGKKLYRVFQNIIDNALKYSLAGSRIFVEMKSSGGKVWVTVKNTAGYEMNFTEEEILQRFTRGDESRTGEGSGLGLSIAESFTQSCGGTFKLDIDGDQFKVTVEFPTVEVSGRKE
jgi:signal transduction histidine kinase